MFLRPPHLLAEYSTGGKGTRRWGQGGGGGGGGGHIQMEVGECTEQQEGPLRCGSTCAELGASQH